MSRKISCAAFVVGIVVAAVTLQARETASKTFTWVNDKFIPIGLSSEGVSVKEIRFEVEGGIHWNPLRAGAGPQCFVEVKNGSGHPMKLAVAVALFDGSGNLIGATESGHIGSLSPDETGEIKMTFREVKRRFFEAKTGQIVLETYQ
jgi:hypothetical protein